MFYQLCIEIPSAVGRIIPTENTHFTSCNVMEALHSLPKYYLGFKGLFFSNDSFDLGKD